MGKTKNPAQFGHFYSTMFEFYSPRSLLDFRLKFRDDHQNPPNPVEYIYHWVAALKKRIRYEDILGTMDAIALFRPPGVPWTRLTLNVLKKNIKKTNKQLAREKTTWVLKCAKLFKLFQCAICEETVIRICTLQWSKVLGAFVTGFRANGTYPWDILRYSNGMETSFGWDQVTGQHQLLPLSVLNPTSEDIPSHHKPSYSKLSSRGVKTEQKLVSETVCNRHPILHRVGIVGHRKEITLLTKSILDQDGWRTTCGREGSMHMSLMWNCLWFHLELWNTKVFWLVCDVSLGQGEKHGCI